MDKNIYDPLYVIMPTLNLEELEKENNKFDSLTFDLKRLSDDEAIRLYGMSNKALYNLFKANILYNDKNAGDEDGDGEHEFDSHKDFATIVSEAFDMDIKDVNVEDDILYQKIVLAKDKETNDSIILIYPLSKYADYTIDELQEKYNRFNLLPPNMKRLSDQESLIIFGDTVRNIYSISRIKLIEKENTDEDPDFVKADIDEYRNNGNLIIDESEDLLSALKLKLDCCSIEKYNCISESVAASLFKKDLDIKLENITSISKEIPDMVPYFTPEEITKLISNEDFDNEALDFYNKYKRDIISGFEEFDHMFYENKIKELFENKADDKKFISYGWNPAVPVTENNKKLVKENMKRYIDENYKISIIDVSKMEVSESSIITDIDEDNTLQPIYIVLSYTDTFVGNTINKIKSSEFCHAAIGFDYTLGTLYSFNLNENYQGLSQESITLYMQRNKNATIKVISLFVTANQKKRIYARLNYYIDNLDKTHYSVKNLFRILFNKKYDDKFNLKLVCSQFVDSLLQAANIDITGKENNLVSPSDFEKSKNTKLFVLYEGLASKYNQDKVRIMVDALRLDKSSLYNLSNPMNLKEATNFIFLNNDIDKIKYIKLDDGTTNEVIEEIRSNLKAGCFISETHIEKSTDFFTKDLFRYSYLSETNVKPNCVFLP